VSPNALRWHVLRSLDLEAQRIAIERERRLEIAHRDPDMIEDGFHFT
jgi:hypothetical protein